MKTLFVALFLSLAAFAIAGDWNIKFGPGVGTFKTVHTTTTGTNFVSIEQTSTGIGQAFVSETFTGTNNLVITTNTHSMELGGQWNEHTSYSSGNFIFSTNRARSSDANTGCYYSTTTPSSADYYVECVIYQQGSTIPGMGPAGRISTVQNTMYFGRYSSTAGEWQLWKIVGGATTSLGTYTSSTSNAASYTIKLEMIGSAIKLYLNGTEIISVVDTEISAAGKAGVRGASQSGGHHIDSVVAVNQ